MSALGIILFSCILLMIAAREIKAPSDHGELVSVSIELCTLLDTLTAIPNNVILLPPSDSGIHPANILDAKAASQAGFSDEAVHALSVVPFLEDGMLGPRTFPQSYSGPNADPDDLRQLRQMLYDEDNLAPPPAIQLTFSEGGYGVIYVYDAKQSKQAYATYSSSGCSCR